MKDKKNDFSRSDNSLMGNVNVDFKNISAIYEIVKSNKDVIEFEFDEGQQTIAATFRSTESSFPNAEHLTEKTWKEVYGIKGGILQLIETIQGKITPGYYVEEEVEFISTSTQDIDNKKKD